MVDLLFAIQRDIARQIAAALRLELSTEEQAGLERIPTQDLTAYDFWLRAYKKLWDHSDRAKQGVEDAIVLFRRALNLHPRFTSPHAGLAFANRWPGGALNLSEF